MQWSVLLPVVLTLIATQNSNGKIVGFLSNLCYTKWALEAFVIANAKRSDITTLIWCNGILHIILSYTVLCFHTIRYAGVWLITRCGALKENNYDLNHWWKCLVGLFAAGLISRIVALILLVTFQKK